MVVSVSMSNFKGINPTFWGGSNSNCKYQARLINENIGPKREVSFLFFNDQSDCEVDDIELKDNLLLNFALISQKELDQFQKKKSRNVSTMAAAVETVFATSPTALTT